METVDNSGGGWGGCRRKSPQVNASGDGPCHYGNVSVSDVPTVSVGDIPEPGPDTVLLDVREDDEWKLGHAPGALHIPLADLPARVEEVDIDAEIYVVCRQGGRSLGAVEYLTRIGYDAFQVSGGMVSWQQNGLPLEGDGDSPAKIY